MPTPATNRLGLSPIARVRAFRAADISPASEATETPALQHALLTEWSASVSDLGTFLPLATAIAMTGSLDFGVILLFAGLMNLLSGWRFRQPIPAQPMKALAAVAITEQLTRGEIAAAGLMVAVCLILLAATGATEWAARLVPRPVVRGIQLGIGLRLVAKGGEWLFGLQWSGLQFGWTSGLPFMGMDSLLVAALVGTLLCAPRLRRIPLLLPVFAAGSVIAIISNPGGWTGFAATVPDLAPQWPAALEWTRGVLHAGLPQLPLTLLNSVVAVCALSSDFFPRRGISPRKMALQLGVINLLAIPFGALPMCHGAGGLAAHYRFGGRSGLSAILLGAMMIGAAILFGPGMVQLLAGYPVSIMAVLLILAGWTLGRVARDAMAGTDLIILLATLLPILLINTAIGFVAGLTLAMVIGRRQPTTERE